MNSVPLRLTSALLPASRTLVYEVRDKFLTLLRVAFGVRRSACGAKMNENRSLRLRSAQWQEYPSNCIVFNCPSFMENNAIRDSRGWGVVGVFERLQQRDHGRRGDATEETLPPPSTLSVIIRRDGRGRCDAMLIYIRGIPLRIVYPLYRIQEEARKLHCQILPRIGFPTVRRFQQDTVFGMDCWRCWTTEQAALIQWIFVFLSPSKRQYWRSKACQSPCSRSNFGALFRLYTCLYWCYLGL